MSGKLTIAPCFSPDDRFVYEVRFHSDIRTGFISQKVPTFDDHIKYMNKHRFSYNICREDGISVGWVGVVYEDIRFAVAPEHHGKGIGTAMLKYIHRLHPKAKGKIFEWNKSSRRAFEKAGIPYDVI